MDLRPDEKPEPLKHAPRAKLKIAQRNYTRGTSTIPKISEGQQYWCDDKGNEYDIFGIDGTKITTILKKKYLEVFEGIAPIEAARPPVPVIAARPPVPNRAKLEKAQIDYSPDDTLSSAKILHEEKYYCYERWDDDYDIYGQDGTKLMKFSKLKYLEVFEGMVPASVETSKPLVEKPTRAELAAAFVRNLDTKEKVLDKVKLINKCLQENDQNFMLSENIDDYAKINVDKQKDASGNLVLNDWDWGISVLFFDKTKFYHTEYSIMYKGILLPITYKCHITINKSNPIRDHISFDVIINYREHGAFLRDYHNLYLKIHYCSDGFPSMKEEDKNYIEAFNFKHFPGMEVMLSILLTCSQNNNFLTNFKTNIFQQGFIKGTFRGDDNILGILFNTIPMTPMSSDISEMELGEAREKAIKEWNKERVLQLQTWRSSNRTYGSSGATTHSSSGLFRPKRRGGGYYYKYLKYKEKYLKLKDSLSKNL